MENQKELLLDYLIHIINDEHYRLKNVSNRNQYAEGNFEVYSKLYEIIKKYNS